MNNVGAIEIDQIKPFLTDALGKFSLLSGGAAGGGKGFHHPGTPPPPLYLYACFVPVLIVCTHPVCRPTGREPGGRSWRRSRRWRNTEAAAFPIEENIVCQWPLCSNARRPNISLSPLLFTMRACRAEGTTCGDYMWTRVKVQG
jgi:hypothetical protein